MLQQFGVYRLQIAMLIFVQKLKLPLNSRIPVVLYRVVSPARYQLRY